jgi:hypothetical protein
MGGFSAEWLQLREPCDTRSRSDELVRALCALLPSRPLQAVDLGSGTGANIRYMAPRLGGVQRWVTVDDDAALIEQQPVRLDGASFHCIVTSMQLHLGVDQQALPLSGAQLVTASALLDLVSAAWLQSLALRCAAQRAVVLFALNYDGRVECQPREPDDDWVIGLVNRHQLRDKGLGPALGPDATSFARDAFGAAGFQFRSRASDWLIEPDEQRLQRELIAGWIGAAREIAPSDAARIARWGQRRHAHVAAGTSRMRVGHQDFIAWFKGSCE